MSIGEVDQTDDGQLEDDLTQLVGVGGRCSYVLIAMLCLILLYPALIDSAWGRVVTACIVSSLIIAVTYAVGRSRAQLIAASALAVTLLLLQGLWFATRQPFVFTLGAVVLLLFLGFAIVQLFGYLMRHGPVTGDKLHAALVIYILAGFLWAGIYTLLNHVRPGSFLVNNARGSALDYYDLLYFSFTTLTSVGYGDLTPATPRAESLVMLEQISGVFYVAVLIARLAGLYPPRHDHPTA